MLSKTTTVPKNKNEFPTRPKKGELINMYCPFNQGKRKIQNRINDVLERIHGCKTARNAHYIEQKELVAIIDEIGLPVGYTYDDLKWFPRDKI